MINPMTSNESNKFHSELLKSPGKIALGEMEIRYQSISDTNANSTYVHSTASNPFSVFLSSLFFNIHI